MEEFLGNPDKLPEEIILPPDSPFWADLEDKLTEYDEKLERLKIKAPTEKHYELEYKILILRALLNKDRLNIKNMREKAFAKYGTHPKDFNEAWTAVYAYSVFGPRAVKKLMEF
jgi:hypothetical protein